MTAVSAVATAFRDLEAKGHALIVQLEEKGHELAGEFRAWFDEFTGRIPALEAEVKADAGQVAHDAEVAAAPVVAEVERDVKQVAEDAEQAVIPSPRSPA